MPWAGFLHVSRTERARSVPSSGREGDWSASQLRSPLLEAREFCCEHSVLLSGPGNLEPNQVNGEGTGKALTHVPSSHSPAVILQIFFCIGWEEQREGDKATQDISPRECGTQQSWSCDRKGDKGILKAMHTLAETVILQKILAAL